MTRCNAKIRGVAPLAAVTLALAAAAGCGRDAAPGPAWDFAAVDAGGNVVVEGASGPHECVLDRRTGLLWEVKQAESGLRHRDDLYTWYSSDIAEHNGEPGLMNGGRCALERCDTEAFVAAVNATGLCGRQDWRLPSRDEALTLLDTRRIGDGPTLDPQYFPHAVSAECWTATTFRLYPQGAWAIEPIYAQDRVDWKTVPKCVRLVSGSKDAVRPKRRGR